jgi:transketolase
MRYDPQDHENPNSDRFILSKGHAAPVLYAVYKELGILTQKDLLSFKNIDSILEGHPTPRFKYAEAATGSLGQGLSIGVGMVYTALMDKRDYTTYVLLGDMEVTEGSVWEAVEVAAFYKAIRN